MRILSRFRLILAASLSAFQSPAFASTPMASATAVATKDSASKPSAPYRHHALVERQMGMYAVYLPKNFQADSGKGKLYPLCLILHGSGSTEIRHGAMSEAYASEDIIFLAPRAPYPAFEVFMKEKEPGWTAWPEFPQEWGEWDDPDFPRQELERVDAVQLYADWIADCVQDVRKRYPIAAGKAIVVGHSQGAAFAHIFAIKHPDLVKAYAAYAGHYGGPGLADDKAAKALAAEKVFPLILHCEADSVVSVNESRDLIRYLQANKLTFDSKLFPGGSHSIATRPNAAIRSFIYKWGLGRTAPPLRGSLIITKILQHSRADSLGLAAGDQIVEYEGKPIRTMDDFFSAIASAEGKQKAAVVIQRAGKEIKFGLPTGKLGVYTGER